MRTVEERLHELGTNRPVAATSPDLNELFRAIDRHRQRRRRAAVMTSAATMAAVIGVVAVVAASPGGPGSPTIVPGSTGQPSQSLPSPTGAEPIASPLDCPPGVESPVADLCGTEIGARIPGSLLPDTTDGAYYLTLTGQAGDVAYGLGINVDADAPGGEDAPGTVCHALVRIKGGRVLDDAPGGCIPLHAPGTLPGGSSASLINGEWWVHQGVADTERVHVSVVDWSDGAPGQVVFDRVVDTVAIPGSPRRVWAVPVLHPHPMTSDADSRTEIEVQAVP